MFFQALQHYLKRGHARCKMTSMTLLSRRQLCQWTLALTGLKRSLLANAASDDVRNSDDVRDSDDEYPRRVVDTLPSYQPQAPASGVVSIWGHGRRDLPWMQPLIRLWERGLQRFQPGVSVDYRMYGTSSGIPSLFNGLGDIAILGEEILPEAAAAFIKATGYPPLGIEIATGSLDVRNFDYAQMCFVHAENPLTRLSLKEMDGIFGAEHRRGTANIRRWGQLGLSGAWRNLPIVPYSWKLDDSFAFFIQQTVLQGSHRWNCDVHEYAHITRADGSIYDHGQQILDALALDRAGIAIANLRYASPRVKTLALSTGDRAPFVTASKRSLIEQTYPLARTIPAVINRAPGTAVPAKLREFLGYVLSREGQQAINQDGKYLPLARHLLLSQRAKLL